MDGLMLSYITRELSEKLAGARVDRVLQPEKDELHLVLRGYNETHRLLLCASANNARAHLIQGSKQNPMEPPMFCMLLRKHLMSSRVRQVRQIAGDRILEIVFDCVDELGERVERLLICEFMGRRSNLIFTEPQGRILDAIRHVGADMSRTREIRPGLLYARPSPQDKLDPALATFSQLHAALESAPPRLDKALADLLMGLSSQSAKEIAYRLTLQEEPHIDVDGRRLLAGPLHKLLSELPTLAPPVLLMNADGDAVDIFPFEQKRYAKELQLPVPSGPSAAMDAYYRLRDKRERITQKTASLARSLRSHIERCENRLTIHEEALAADQRIEQARICGELLTANLHLIGKSAAEVAVPDYYTGNSRVIPLDPRLSPAHNAQRYFKQYRKLRTAQLHATEQVAQIRADLDALETQLDDLRKCEDVADLDEIRSELVRGGYLRASHNRGAKPRKPAPTKPMQAISSDGIPIRIGRNSAQNDRLTFSAPPDTLWLHAKNMTGSHVLVDCEGEPPEQTLREAAQLAAWFSRGYRSSQVPVDYTRRKYVKKPSGAAVGFVIYTHQQTLYITPDERQVKALLERGGTSGDKAL